MINITKYCLRIFLALMLLLCLSSCNKDKSLREKTASEPFRNLKKYAFNPQTPLVSRINAAPEFVLKHLREMDGNNTYAPAGLSAKDIDLVAEYLDMLPQLHKKILQDRLIGIYFINNFQGSGMAEYVLDEKNEIYSILILNPVVLQKNISELLVWKENTCFIKDSPDLRLDINGGSQFRGLMYILLHESTHIIDYVLNYTPYVEEDIREIRHLNKDGLTDFVKGIWSGYSRPANQYNYLFRDKVAFYGFNKGPRIKISEAEEVYKQLAGTPFVSLYASQSWAEDFADAFTFYHLTQKLGQPYEIRLLQGNRLVFSYSPMKEPKVKERFPVIESLY